VDDPRQHQQIGSIEAQRAVGCVRADVGNHAVRNLQRSLGDVLAEQSASAVDENIRHVTAICLGALTPLYLLRKSSTGSLRKPGSACLSISWSQSHQASSISPSSTACENRRRSGRAGLPATIV